MSKTIPISEIHFPESFNARVKYENLPNLVASIKARGFDESFPLQVKKLIGEKAKETGCKYELLGGFTRFQAAQKLELEQVPAIVVDYDSTASLVNLITSNMGQPLSRYEQGGVYIRLRDQGLDPEALQPGEEVREKPRSLVEIADLVGYSNEHIRNCITIHEAPEPIREMLESEQVAANAVVDAMKISAEKAPAILKAAIKAAKDEGKDKATSKHVKEVKPQFVELKGKTPKQLAKENQQSEEPTSSGDYAATETAEDEPEAGSDTNTAEEQENAATEAPESGNEASGEQGSFLPEDDTKDQLFIAINEWSDMRGVVCSDEDKEHLVDSLIDAGFHR